MLVWKSNNGPTNSWNPTHSRRHWRPEKRDRERSVQQYHSFASFCPPFLHSSYPSAFRVARSALLSSDLNTGPVVDVLSTRPTGADKLLASPSEPWGRKPNRATGNPHLPPITGAGRNAWMMRLYDGMGKVWMYNPGLKTCILEIICNLTLKG